MNRVYITSESFGEASKEPLLMLKDHHIDYLKNPTGRKQTTEELIKSCKDCSAIILGTNSFDKNVIKALPKLRMISRMGVGLSNIDMDYSKKMGIKISYTPDGPSNAVAELTLSLILDLLRSVTISDRRVRNGLWEKRMGKELSEITIGIIGLGRIGRLVIEKLLILGCKSILVFDLNSSISTQLKEELDPDSHKIISKSLEDLLSSSDIVSLHLPFNENTNNMIGDQELSIMRNDSCIINTSRGGIINEKDLYVALDNKKIYGAAIDTFNEEPYSGKLINMDNCILTSHIGSLTSKARLNMELQCTSEVIRYFQDLPLQQEVSV